MIYPHHDTVSEGYPILSDQDKLVDRVSVARVQPRTSKGITDLLLPQTSLYLVQSPSKKSCQCCWLDYLAG